MIPSIANRIQTKEGSLTPDDAGRHDRSAILMKTGWRVAGMVCILVSFLGSSVVLHHVQAASTINVTTTLDEYRSGSLCSLREAVQAANTNLAFGGCPAGSGPFDTINLLA